MADSGWAWVVCGAMFCVVLLVFGFSYTVSVYYVAFLDVFGETRGTTAWISALNMGALCCSGQPTARGDPGLVKGAQPSSGHGVIL